MSHRHYIAPPWSDLPEFTLPDDVFHHAITVMRSRVGDVLQVFDGQGRVSSIKISAIHKKNATAVWQAAHYYETQNESPLKIHLVQCISAADKMDWTIEKAVELGVSSITPLLSHKSQVKLTPERALKRQEHWQRLILAACAQSGRNVLPKLFPIGHLTNWLAQEPSQCGLPLILHPHEQADASVHLSQLMQSAHWRAAQNTQAKLLPEVYILVGSESGFAPQELALAKQHGWLHIQLGSRILRTETAGLAAIAALQVLCGDF